jgi:mycothiol synthase
MSSLRVRQLRREDAEDVARLFVESFGEARQMDAGEIEEWLGNEALDPEKLLVLVDGDRVVGYFDLWLQEETVDIDLAAPGIWDEALGHAENVARALGAKKARTFFVAGHDVERVVSGRGYGPIRASWTMEIEFGVEAPAESPVPDGIDIRPYRHPDDERAVYEAHVEAFADHWEYHREPFEQWRQFTVEARNFDPSLWLVAWADAEVAGYALNYPERPGDPGYGFVGTLGVRRPWRRHGLGEALLRRSFAALHARGQRKVRLTVDAENPTGATRLYERAGMRVLRQANTWERELE